ncbi:MAG: hypothetical protein JXQ72_12235, partial [Anaerolineae bacterium]|nr:hypothetical protein [Anaerolineae bacterium]
MPLRAIYALGLLVISLGVVFVLVGDAGVETSVFTSDPTLTPLPPTPTPEPVGSSDKWTEDEASPGTWTYVSDDETVQATITEQVLSLADAATYLGVMPPSDDAAAPTLDMLNQFYAQFEDALTQLPAGQPVPFELGEPVIRLFGSVPVALSRLVIEPGANPNFLSGLDTTFAMIEVTDGTVSFIQQQLLGPKNDDIYVDFEAWLTTNAPDLAAGDEAESEDTEDAEDTGDTGDTGADDAEAEDTSEDTSAESEEPTEEPTEEPAADADTNADEADEADEADQTADTDAGDTDAESEEP